MSNSSFSLKEYYWDDFKLQDDDVEFLYNHLLETETPMTTQKLIAALVTERVRREKLAIEQRRMTLGTVYLPKQIYDPKDHLVFPALNWETGEVVSVRPGKSPDLGDFQVIQVILADGITHEFAANLTDHALNEPAPINQSDPSLDTQSVIDDYGESLAEYLEEELSTRDDFVRIGGNWFPKALLLDVTPGHLNLVEAVLDMAGGGPLPTSGLIEQIELSSNVNPKLLEFSLDLALQNDPRFDEVGPSGKVLWFLNRLEPAEVLEPPIYLRYSGYEYDRSALTEAMLNLERELDDELSPLSSRSTQDEIEVRLIYPHWRAGTLPLSTRLRHLFPTAYEAPRIRFSLVDGLSGESFPAWVVREKRYVFGLKSWYEKYSLLPGSLLHVRRGKKPGEVILKVDSRRPSREWIRTVLVGSDGGVVFAMLKQYVSTSFDERMTIAIPDPEALDHVWTHPPRESQALEKSITSMVRELSKLNPQGHVHASELYAAINVVRRCPPAPMLALLGSHPGFTHVGDLHFRFTEGDRA
jgi:hypothetical protein